MTVEQPLDSKRSPSKNQEINTTVDSDPFNLLKERNPSIGEASKGFKDLLCINALQEQMEENYLTYIKKSDVAATQSKTDKTTEADKSNKLGKKKRDLYIAVTKAVNKTATTTPLDPGKSGNCDQAKYLTSAIQKNVVKLVENKSGIRDTKSLAQIAFHNKFNQICIDETYHEVWNNFYNSMISVMGDAPSTLSKFKYVSSIAGSTPKSTETDAQPTKDVQR